VINGNFTNDGRVRVSAGKLEIEGAVTGAGTDTISGPAKLQFDAGVSSDQDVDLSGKGGTMALVDPTGFYGKISDFGSNDTVKLEGLWAFSALSHASGVTTLTLAEGATRHAFEFVGDYTRREFHISSGVSRKSHTCDTRFG
jgi:large repetitive protein